MCYALTLPVICALQMVSRVFITALFAAEDLVRLVIHTVHSYLSSILQMFSFVPICLAYCFAKQCFCTGLGSGSSGCYPKSTTSCSCSVVIILTIIVIIVLYYTFWVEDLLEHIKIKLPCIIFRKTRNKEIAALRTKYENQTNSDIGLNTSLRYQNIADNDEKPEVFSRDDENTNISNEFTELLEYLISNEHQTVRQTTVSVDYFNLAAIAPRVDIGNETAIAEHNIKETKDKIGLDNLTNYRMALRL